MYKKWCILVLAAAVAFAVAAPPAGPLPPKAQFYGHSLAEWLKFYWAWYFTGVPESGEVNGALLLPLPAGTPDDPNAAGTYNDPVTYCGHLDIEVKAGTPFVLPIIAWLGEIYENGDIDTPYPDEWFGTYVSGPVTLDGQPIVQDFQAYYVPPTNFDEIIYYPEPTSYGSIGLAYFQGVGFVCAPLSVGVHELANNAGFMIPPGEQPYENLGLIYNNSWTITVVP
jgi:hypothetical protein